MILLAHHGKTAHQHTMELLHTPNIFPKSGITRLSESSKRLTENAKTALFGELTQIFPPMG